MAVAIELSDQQGKSWNTRAHDLPDRLVLQAEVGVSKKIAQACHVTPPQLGIAMAYIVVDLLGGFSEEFEIA